MEDCTESPSHEEVSRHGNTHKHCPRCKATKSVSEFSKNKARDDGKRDGLASYCKLCVREYGRNKGYDKRRWLDDREAEYARHVAYMQIDRDTKLARYRDAAAKYRKENPAKVNATNRARSKNNFVPRWADKKAMLLMYEKRREWSETLGIELEVDHIVPLKGKTVCGLHCEANLQLLEKTINHKKRNFEWPDMP